MERLVEVTRGPLIESVHRGSIAVVNFEGKLIASVGDPESMTYYRSAAKPIQAIPVMTSGAAQNLGLTEPELAIICASHSGQTEHVEIVRGIMDKLGIGSEVLLCGTHPPFHGGSAREIWRKGCNPEIFHCNCSGKHCGMLAICKHKGWDYSNYTDPEHPVQKMLLEFIKSFHDYQEVMVGVDGCGVPVYGLPLKELAKGYARLVQPKDLDTTEAKAAKRIIQAVTNNPSLVAGTGRLDTVIMEVVGAKVMAKCGAEGVQCLALPDKGIGIAIKIEDGNLRATEPVAIEVLAQLGILGREELTRLGSKHVIPVSTNLKAQVGEIRPAFKLKFA